MVQNMEYITGTYRLSEQLSIVDPGSSKSAKSFCVWHCPADPVVVVHVVGIDQASLFQIALEYIAGGDCYPRKSALGQVGWWYTG